MAGKEAFPMIKFPYDPALVEPKNIERLEQAISIYFHNKEGRSKNCKIECYRRYNLDYFFAYPEDQVVSAFR